MVITHLCLSGVGEDLNSGSGSAMRSMRKEKKLMRGRGRRKRRGAGCSRRVLSPPALVMTEHEAVGVKGDQCVQQIRRKQDSRWGMESKLMSQQTSKQGFPEEDKPPPELRPYRPGRPRNTRFSYAENMTLISKVVPVYEQLLGNLKCRIPRSRKTQMWQKICDAVNRVGRRQRFIHHCKKRFHDIKKQLRTKLNREKSVTSKEGTSPSQTWYTQYEEELKKVLPAEVIDGIEFFDSDQPQHPSMEQEAGPSWILQPHDKEKKKEAAPFSDAESYVSLDSETEELPADGNILPAHLTSTPRLNPTNVVKTNTPSLENVPQESRVVQVQIFAKPRKHDFYHVRRQPSRKRNINAFCPMQSPLKQLKSMKAAQCLFHKSIMHNLKVLHWDIGHFAHHMDINHEMAKKMLQVETQKNDILLQMSNNIDRLAESIQQLTSRQQAEQVLFHNLLHVKRS